MNKNVNAIIDFMMMAKKSNANLAIIHGLLKLLLKIVLVILVIIQQKMIA